MRVIVAARTIHGLCDVKCISPNLYLVAFYHKSDFTTFVENVGQVPATLVA